MHIVRTPESSATRSAFIDCYY